MFHNRHTSFGTVAARRDTAPMRPRWLLLVLALSGCKRLETAPREPTPTPTPSTSARTVVLGASQSTTSPSSPTGNRRPPTFQDAKVALQRIYLEGGARADLYCGCPFRARGRGLEIELAACPAARGSSSPRATRIEWEHVVPASRFGHTFDEWRRGAPACRSPRGDYHGRTCARAASPEFARIEADMHNLFPVLGEMNAKRSDFPLGAGPDGAAHGPSFTMDACESAVVRGVFVPRPTIRGELARAVKYMGATYPRRVVLRAEERALLDRWDADDPPDAWEVERDHRIAAVQGNSNPFIRAHARDGERR